jgi:hypothetical protein
MRWQIVAGFGESELLEVVPHAKPYPKLLMRQNLADGSDVIVVWSYIQSLKSANVVSVFFPRS